MESCDHTGTPMEIKDKLDVDQNGTPIDAMKYRCMIGALMYLTSSRPDIVHATCLCARYQAKPTEKHLKEVKRIFRYLQGTVNMGLWYTKDSSFELTGFSDADYAGCKDTFKSTSGGAQFLGEKLEHEEKGTIELYFVKTDYQLADIFTKALPTDRFNYLVRHLVMEMIRLSLSPQSNYDIEDVFSSINVLDYFPATPGKTSPDSSNDLTKYLLATLVFLPLHDDPYMEVMQAYDATNELPIPPLQAPIASPTVVPLVLLLFDPQDFLPLRFHH
nr:uncharacterized mitochondrial protein AtMg00810-like [Tanacetum cinerariifolium]